MRGPEDDDRVLAREHAGHLLMIHLIIEQHPAMDAAELRGLPALPPEAGRETASAASDFKDPPALLVKRAGRWLVADVLRCLEGPRLGVGLPTGGEEPLRPMIGPVLKSPTKPFLLDLRNLSPASSPFGQLHLIDDLPTRQAAFDNSASGQRGVDGLRPVIDLQVQVGHQQRQQRDRN